jgi:uncharacterized protein
MFPESRDLISELKYNDIHFTRLFEKHHALDHRISNMDNHLTSGTHEEIERLKKEKLLLKDQIYRHLQMVIAKD